MCMYTHRLTLSLNIFMNVCVCVYEKDRVRVCVHNKKTKWRGALLHYYHFIRRVCYLFRFPGEVDSLHFTSAFNNNNNNSRRQKRARTPLHVSPFRSIVRCF